MPPRGHYRSWGHFEKRVDQRVLGELKSQTFVLDVRVQGSPPAGLPWLRMVDENTCEVDVAEGESLNHIFAQLSQMGVEVGSMKNKTNRLEELFLRLVGDNADAPE